MNYNAQKKCKNCGTMNWLSIEQGMTIEEYCNNEHKLCNVCRCPLIKSKEKEE